MFTVIKDAEIKLVETVGGLADEANNWRAVYFHFDKLLEQYRSEYQIQIAVNLLNDLLAAHQGGVFVCADRTLILLCRNVIKSQLEKAVFQLRYLFMDDPLAYDAGGDENPRFCQIFDLGIEYAEFHQLCRKKMSQGARIEQVADTAVRAHAESVELSSKAFTPARLTHIQHDLNKADLSRVLRRQPVCAVTPEYDIRKVFDEYYIHIASLRQMLRSEADFVTNRSLFRYLTVVLDERVLDLLGTNPAKYFDTPVSINLNIETLLSKRFREFDSIIKPSAKSSVVVEIQIGEVFSDIAGFMAAKNMLQKLGYRVCLDGLTNQSVVHINREALGFDLAKVQWNADLEIDLATKENLGLAQAIKNCGQNRIILCRCDTRQAITYGQAMGINLFQGRFLDRILNPNQKIDN